jgi:hypothetical protein
MGENNDKKRSTTWLGSNHFRPSTKNLEVKDVTLFTGSSVEDVRAAFDREPIDIVIIGAGLDMDVRLEIVKLIFL